MESVNPYVAVIDMGSSRILACLGRVDNEGKLHILASERVSVDTEIRRGVIQNVNEVAVYIRSMLNTLENNSSFPCRIEKVYVGINAYTMYSINASSSTQPNEEEDIDDAMIESMWEDAEERYKPEKKDVLYRFVQCYMVDGFQCMDPRGERPTEVSANYKIVVGKPSIMKNLEESFVVAGKGNEFRHLLGILASCEAVLSMEDKMKGVVVVDFGADTTGICVYKDNVVRHVAVLPFGGNSITNDLKQLNLNVEEAEELKRQKGTALHYTELMAEKKLSREPSSEEQLINEIVVARVEEIVENIWAQIHYSGISTAMLSSGIVVTGGASQLRDLKTILQHKTNLPVHEGDLTMYLSDDTDPNYSMPEYAQSIGLMLLGKDGCKPVSDHKTEELVEEQILFHPDEVKSEFVKNEMKKKNVVKPENPPKRGGLKQKWNQIISGFDDAMSE